MDHTRRTPSRPARRSLRLDKIRLDGNTQPRVELDEFLIEEYREAYARDVDMPPLQVMFDGASYWLWDGFHRRWGAERAGLEKLSCIVTEGTQQDAQWASYGANITHGLRRTRGDIRKAVLAALRHPKAKSDRQVAEHVGVHFNTVGKYRAEMESEGTITKCDSREGRDGRTINTANIGKRKPKDLPVKVPTDDSAITLHDIADLHDDDAADQRHRDECAAGRHEWGKYSDGQFCDHCGEPKESPPPAAPKTKPKRTKPPKRLKLIDFEPHGVTAYVVQMTVERDGTLLDRVVLVSRISDDAVQVADYLAGYFQVAAEDWFDGDILATDQLRSVAVYHFLHGVGSDLHYQVYPCGAEGQG